MSEIKQAQRSDDEKLNAPIVFPKPASACEEETKSGDTRVKGNRAMQSVEGQGGGGGDKR
jgi:hypothetical protein